MAPRARGIPYGNGTRTYLDRTHPSYLPAAPTVPAYANTSNILSLLAPVTGLGLQELSVLQLPPVAPVGRDMRRATAMGKGTGFL